jgi:hypothetical protein
LNPPFFTRAQDVPPRPVDAPQNSTFATPVGSARQDLRRQILVLAPTGLAAATQDLRAFNNFKS